MKTALLRIHARLCGDGHITSYATNEPDRKERTEVGYTNKDPQNRQEFKQDLNECFGVEATEYDDTVKVKSGRIAEELESLGTFATATWRPPQQLFDEPDEHKLEWLRAFIRDEGYFDETNNRLRIKSMNKTGLTSIKELLATLDVPSKVTGPNSDDSYYLTVSRLNNFKDLESIAKSKKKVRK